VPFPARVALHFFTTGFIDNKVLMRLEHIAFNVLDPENAAKWYVENLEMSVLRRETDPPFTRFVADAGRNVMLKLFSGPKDARLDFSIINHMSLHLAFTVSDILTMKKRLVEAGATLVEDVTKTPAGDLVLMLRDPLGLPIQFAQRVHGMLPSTGMRPEHFALNVRDSRALAKWLIDSVGMKMIREGRAPTYGCFVADDGLHMMLELYQNMGYPMLELGAQSDSSFHIGWTVSDVAATKRMLMDAGALLERESEHSLGNDSILIMRDPSVLPMRFIERSIPILS
jgi:catechol 2,3-dioxygenase-like lactoylglutathione lyase family enzyme